MSQPRDMGRRDASSPDAARREGRSRDAGTARRTGQAAKPYSGSARGAGQVGAGSRGAGSARGSRTQGTKPPERSYGRKTQGGYREVSPRDGDGFRTARGQERTARPAVTADVTADQLDPAARAELRTLPSDLAEAVARLLVAAGLTEAPELGYEYAVAARDLAARVGVVRETCGIAAYRAGKWSEALAELRAARRLTGQSSYLPLMADCERALGRLDRALDLVTGPAVRDLSREVQIEMRIVESGIRRDQGFPEAGVVALQIPELADERTQSGSARLFYAYADALIDAGRADEARYWFGKAAAADLDGDTDAAERVEDMDMLVFEDLDDFDDLEGTEDLAAPEGPGTAPTGNAPRS